MYRLQEPKKEMSLDVRKRVTLIKMCVIHKVKMLNFNKKCGWRRKTKVKLV
jgi:hypothetical protein